MEPRLKDYMRSLSAELDVQHRRVRSLIGSAHWPTDGHYKEHLLQALLARFTPTATRLGRGFVVGNFDAQTCSRELDIVIADRSSEAPLFDEAGVVICGYKVLLAAISVKSRFGAEEVVDAVQTLASVPFTATETMQCWGGVYCFDDGNADHQTETIKRWMKRALSEDPTKAFPEIFIRATPSLLIKVTSGRVTTYALENLATAAFLACLMDSISARFRDRSTFADFAEAVLEEAVVGDLSSTSQT